MSTTSVTKKALMGLTGLVLTVFMVAHLAGNLLYYSGAARIDAYGALLHASPTVLWSVRAVLFASAVIHVGVAIDLYVRRAVARPVAYGRYDRVASSPGARTMLVTGLVLLGFIVYHILHLTVGLLHPAFVPGALHWNVTRGFASITATGIYLAAMVALGLHMSHGVYSMTQSLGAALRPHGMRTVRRIALALALLVAVGLASIPITVIATYFPRAR